MTDTNTMRFRADGSFHILQVSDPQDLAHPRKAMLKLLDAAYDALRPDLVLFTGDNTLGNHLTDAFGYIKVRRKEEQALTRRRMQTALSHILQPVEDRGIPFAMIFGNHDDMNCVPKREQFAYYRAYTHCLPMHEADPTADCGTYAIPLCGADGVVKWNLYMLESAWNDETGQHWQIKEETVRWYTQTSERMQAQTGAPVPSLLFLHVPLPQTKELCMPCDTQRPGAVRDGGRYYCLDPAKARGQLRESISAAEDPFGLFEAIRTHGDVRAVVSGHDHVNCFDGVHDGVRFIQSGAASFRCYGDRIRGVREFVLFENDPRRFDTAYYTYDDLCGKNFGAQLRYFWDADDKMAMKYTLLGVTALAAAGAGLAHRLAANKRK